MFAILILTLLISIAVVLTLIISNFNAKKTSVIVTYSDDVAEEEEVKAPEAIVDRNVIDSLLEGDQSETGEEEPPNVEEEPTNVEEEPKNVEEETKITAISSLMANERGSLSIKMPVILFHKIWCMGKPHCCEPKQKVEGKV